ncbi:hypothetical protein [Acinetobacter baumannii]
MKQDNSHYNYYYTEKGSDWLEDQDPIESMSRERTKVEYEIEH